MTNGKNTTKSQARRAAAAEAVRARLGIETLETRGRDALDFHSVSVANLLDAVRIAFEAGYDAGHEDGTALAK